VRSRASRWGAVPTDRHARRAGGVSCARGSGTAGRCVRGTAGCCPCEGRGAGGPVEAGQTQRVEMIQWVMNHRWEVSNSPYNQRIIPIPLHTRHSTLRPTSRHSPCRHHRHHTTAPDSPSYSPSASWPALVVASYSPSYSSCFTHHVTRLEAFRRIRIQGCSGSRRINSILFYSLHRMYIYICYLT